MGQRKQWYAGPRGYEEWKRTPAISQDFSPEGYSDGLAYINGGIGIRKSADAHKVYNLSWNLLPRDDARAITDMAHGVWDGDDEITLIYHLDPMAMDKNLFNRSWGTPSLAGRDAMPLYRDQDPTIVPTPANNYRYPARSARYNAQGTSEVFYCPLPPGFSAWLGWHGSRTGAGAVRVTPYNGASAGTPVLLTPLTENTSQLVNREFQANSGITGIEIDLTGSTPLENQATNPSFELNLTGAAASVNGGGGVVALSRSTAGGKDGTAAARATWTTAATAAGGGLYVDVPVDAGVVKSYSAFARTSIATRVRMVIQFLKADGSVISASTQNGSQVVTAANPAWTAVTTPLKIENVTTPAGAVTARIWVQTVAGTSYVNMSASSWMEMDAIQVNNGATAQTFASGNTAGWQWLGTVGASASQQIPDTITLSGLILQVIPTGNVPAPGNYISGQGNSGCQFSEEPKETAYSRALDLVSISAKLVETGVWL